MQLPETAGVEYELALHTGEDTVTWPVRVPEQEVPDDEPAAL